jgi:hypothetical protein
MTPVEQVAALIRIDNHGENHDTRIEVQFDGKPVLLPQGVAQALVTILGERLLLAAKIDRQHIERHGSPPEPELRFSSDLTVKLDVVHDIDRDELVQMVAARLGGILEREGCDVWGADLASEPNIRETAADAVT